jgi:hypothetical protein
MQVCDLAPRPTPPPICHCCGSMQLRQCSRVSSISCAADEWAWVPACSRAQPLPALLPAVYDVYHRCKDLGTAINTTVSYQYVTLNAPFDIFQSYLDVRPCCHSPDNCLWACLTVHVNWHSFWARNAAGRDLHVCYADSGFVYQCSTWPAAQPAVKASQASCCCMLVAQLNRAPAHICLNVVMWH